MERKTYRKPELCPHGVLGKAKCRQCRAEYLVNWKEKNPKYKEKHVEEAKIQRELKPKVVEIYVTMHKNPDEYPLAKECFYTGTEYCLSPKGAKVEHGHLDYENEGRNYVTVCHSCNHRMEKRPKMMELAWDYIKGLREAGLTKGK